MTLKHHTYDPSRLLAFVLFTGIGQASGEIDLARDGLSDLWQLRYNAQALNAVADTDGDGLPNWMEAIAGTNPRDGKSGLDSNEFTVTAELVTLRWQGVRGKEYLLETSNDLETWTPHGATRISAGGMEESSMPLSGEKMFCRIGVRDTDSDADGLNDYEEELLGFDPESPNSSGTITGGDSAEIIKRLTSGENFQLDGQTVRGSMPTAEQASRFLMMATLGADRDEIARVEAMGYSAWIDDQFTKSPGLLTPGMRAREAAGQSVFADAKRRIFWKQVLTSDDLLRQRLAFLFSEIWVISDVELGNFPFGMADYYDMLLNRSFGNVRDILYDVTLHPTMGDYLSHLRNRKPDPLINRFADENFAREIMQLFSIGLFELNPDGTRKKDVNGDDIPTYSNTDITNFARVFTGLTFGGPGNLDGQNFFHTRNYLDPMAMNEMYHDTDEKILLQHKNVTNNSHLLPAFTDDPGRKGLDDINDALDNIFTHPNVGPFLARLIIQRLVTSNPSPEYIQRITHVFQDNGLGVRGDLRAVIKAILLDPEAITPPSPEQVGAGRLREPYIRALRLSITFNARDTNGNYDNPDHRAPNLGQAWFRSPTVFNFFSPDHRPNGLILEAGLDAPEFQVLNSVTAVASLNFLKDVIENGPIPSIRSTDPRQLRLNYTEEIALAGNPEALVDRLDLLLTYGSMSSHTRETILTAINGIQASDSRKRVETALRLLVNSPDYAIFR